MIEINQKLNTMKQKLLLIALLCIGCTLVSNAQRKPAAKPVTTRPAQSTTAATQHRPASRAASAAKVGQSLADFEKSGGKPFMDVLRDRENPVSLQRENIEPEQLSKMLWVACGQNPQNVLTAMQTTQTLSVEIYLINENGIYKYESENHQLNCIRKGQYLNLLMGNEISVDAATALFFVFQPNMTGSENRPVMTEMEAGINCGAIMQNVTLFCSSEDLVGMPVSFSENNKAELLKAINLPEAIIMYGMAIGRK